MGTTAAPDPDAAGQGTAGDQPLLTRFIVFEPVTGQGPNPLIWKIVGSELGRDRQNAARKFFGSDEPPLHVAVSENQWRPKQPRDAPFEVPHRVDGSEPTDEVDDEAKDDHDA